MGMGRRSSQEVLAAVVVAVIAFAAQPVDTGIILRVVYAVLALAVLFAASVALDIYQDAKAQKDQPKANPFEIRATKIELPTAPPGGVFEAALHMAEHLQDFPLTLKSDLKEIDNGFQISEGQHRLRVRVNAGTAIGWEQGGDAWCQQRDLWMSAVRAAPRATEVVKKNWMGTATVTAPTDVVAVPAAPLGKDVPVIVSGLQSKPELNGKPAVIVKDANEAGRFGVRLEGRNDAMLLKAANLEPMPPFDSLGVSVPCLRSFRNTFSSLTSGMTAAQVVEGLVQPLTGSSRVSLARTLQLRDATDEAGKALAAPATVILIVPESESFDDMLTAVEEYAAASDKPEEVYVWMDSMCRSHHAAPLTDFPMAWWTTTFKAGVQEIGSACVLLSSWDDPRVLTQSWCWWQLHCVLANKLTLSVQMLPGETVRLQEQLLDDMDEVTKAWDRRFEAGWRKADVPKPEHKANINSAIERSDDFGGKESRGASAADEFSGRLLSALHVWLLERAKAALDLIPADERACSKLLDRVASLLQEHNDLEAAETLCYEQVAGRRKKLGPRHTDTLDAVNNLALLLHQLGKLEEAEPLSKEKLMGCRSQLGDNHPDTITAIDTYSQLLSDLGNLQGALPLKRESLGVKRKVLGDRHPDTLLSVNNLAVLLNDLGRATGNPNMLREAEPLKREALAGCREVLGNRHPHTLASIANLSDMLMQLGHADPRAFEEAEPLCREALTGSREVLGDFHPDTLKAVGNLAALLVDQAHRSKPKSKRAKAKLSEALPLYAEAVQGFTKGLGSTHPTTLSYVNEYSRLLLDTGKAKEAEDVQGDAVSTCRTTLGDSHPETLVTITHMAGLLRAQDKLAEAEPLAREVLAGWRKVEAGEKVPRHTLTAINIVAELLHSRGKDEEAEPLCKEVLVGFNEALGPKHPFTLSAAENLSGVLRSMGRINEAELVLKKFDIKYGPGQGPNAAGPPPGFNGMDYNGSGFIEEKDDVD